MNDNHRPLNLALRWAPAALLGLLCVLFGVLSSRFATPDNLAAILAQSSYLIVVALGVNFVLLTAGVDLSVGAVMYLAALSATQTLAHAPLGVQFVGTLLVGAAFGGINALLIVYFELPSFISTLATIFIGRGVGLYISSTRIVYASPILAEFGRSHIALIPAPLWIAALSAAVAWIVLNRTALGPYVRSLGADEKGAARAGVPVRATKALVFTLSGLFAGAGGFTSLSQTSAATGAFGQNTEFLAIAAAVLGGTSLFGGRGSVWAPVLGAILITTVQNGLGLIDANPYAYPVITGAVIFIAALFDSLRTRLISRLQLRVRT